MAVVAIALLRFLPELPEGSNYLILALIVGVHWWCERLCKREDESSTTLSKNTAPRHPLEE